MLVDLTLRRVCLGSESSVGRITGRQSLQSCHIKPTGRQISVRDRSAYSASFSYEEMAVGENQKDRSAKFKGLVCKHTGRQILRGPVGKFREFYKFVEPVGEF